MPIFHVLAMLAAPLAAVSGQGTSTSTEAQAAGSTLAATLAIVRTSSAAVEPPAPTTNEAVGAEAIDIVVTGSRTEKRLSETPVATELIGRKELAASGADNLLEVLEERPGIQLERSTAGAGIRMQGLNPEQVLILIDGERLAGRIRGGIDPWRFDLESIEQIEIVKGSASALYGSDAMGGVINIIPRRPRPGISSNARASFGSFATVDGTAAIGYRRGRGSLELSGGYHRTDGFDLTPDDEVTTGPKTDAWSLSANGAWDADSSTRFRFRGDLRRSAISAVDLVRPRALIDREEQIDNYSFSVGPDIKLGDGRMRASVYFSSFRGEIKNDQRGGTFYDGGQDNRQRISQATLQYDRPIFGHLITLGVDGIHEEQRVEFLASGREQRRRGAIFAQDEWSLLEGDVGLVLVPGIRFDADSQFGSRPSPKLAVRFDPLDWVVLRASYAWGFQAPSFEQLHLSFINPGSGYRVEGNPELKAVTSQSANFDAEISPLDSLAFRLGAYYNDLSDLIDTQRSAANTPEGLNVFRYQNVASARTMGVELGVRIQIDKRLTLDGGYDLTDTKDRTLDRPLPGRARHRGTVRALFSHQAWGLKASARASFVGSQPFFADLRSDGGDDVGDPYATLDLRIAQEILGFMEVEAGSENLLDAGDPVLLAIPPRSFFVGLSGRWSAGLDDQP